MSDYEIPHPRDLVSLALGYRAEGEPPSYDELVGEDLPIEAIAELWLSVRDYQRAAKNVLDAVASHLGELLAEAGSGLEINDEWVYFGKTKKHRIVDEAGFWEWIKSSPEFLEAAFNPNNIRKTGIPASVFDTFFEMVETPKPTLSSIPVYVLEQKQKGKRND